MELPVSEQALAFVTAVFFGVALGVVFDFLRALRREAKNSGITALCDFLLCLMAAAALFCLNMLAAGGKLRLFLAAAAVLGAAAYFLSISRFFLALFGCFFAWIGKELKKLAVLQKKIAKMSVKLKIFLKKRFKKMRKWFTIKANNGVVGKKSGPRHLSAGLERTNENQKNEPNHTNRYCGSCALRGDKPGKPESSNQKSRKTKRRVSGTGGRSGSGKRRTTIRH
ncbi:MAG: hypothetical protein EOM14_02490 [Clostridia bacterium]|nr:hypothetical protein [Clostridia bacterium]